MAAVLQAQRKATVATLQDLTRTQRSSAGRDDAWELVVEAMIFPADAEIRWLDHTESKLARRAAHATGRGPLRVVNDDAVAPVNATEVGQ